MSEGSTTGVVYGIPTSDAFLSLGCMEGMYHGIVEPVAVEVAREEPAAWPGYVLASGVALAAYGLHYLPLTPFTVVGSEGLRHPISAAIIAIILGLVVRNTIALPSVVKPGCKQAVKKAIPPAIVLTGAGLNFTYLAAGIGAGALLITVVSVLIALGSGYLIARALGLRSHTAMLLGAGTGICGNSAIVAVAPLIEAEDEDVALAIGTVNLFGLVAMLAWPVIGGWLLLSEAGYGVWAGASIHAVPQVVAAGFAYSAGAAQLATLVKLVRVALLAPLVFILAVVCAQRRSVAPPKGSMTIHYARFVPWFVWGFLGLALLNTLGLLPTLHFDLAPPLSTSSQAVSVQLDRTLTSLGKLLLTVAMAAIGLEVNLRHLMGVGSRAILAGLLSTAAVGGASLFLIKLLLV